MKILRRFKKTLLNFEGEFRKLEEATGAEAQDDLFEDYGGREDDNGLFDSFER